MGGAILGSIFLVSVAFAQVVKLNGPLAREVVGYVGSFAISPDGTRVVYWADERIDGVYELFESPADGSQPPLLLNAAIVPGGSVLEYRISSDSSRVVFRADKDTNDVAELYSVPIDGSASPSKLNGALVASGDVVSFEISPSADRVVYRADQDADEVYEVFSVPIDASSAPVQLNGPLVGGGDVLEFRISSDGARVVFRADAVVADRDELYSAPIDGGAPPVTLNGALASGGDVAEAPLGASAFVISPTSDRVVYLADQDADELFELFSVPIAGGTAIQLNGTLVAGGDVSRGTYAFDGFDISSDGSRVVYLADQDINDVTELYAVPIAGGQAPVKLDPALPSGRRVSGFRIAPDALRVAYVANQDVAARDELYSAALDGSGAAIKLNGSFNDDQDVVDFSISADSARVVYLRYHFADVFGQVIVDQTELFSSPLDGSAGPVQLNHALNPEDDVIEFEITPDSAQVLYPPSSRMSTTPFSCTA